MGRRIGIVTLFWFEVNKTEENKVTGLSLACRIEGGRVGGDASFRLRKDLLQQALRCFPPHPLLNCYSVSKLPHFRNFSETWQALCDVCCNHSSVSNITFEKIQSDTRDVKAFILSNCSPFWLTNREIGQEMRTEGAVAVSLEAGTLQENLFHSPHSFAILTLNLPHFFTRCSKPFCPQDPCSWHEKNIRSSWASDSTWKRPLLFKICSVLSQRFPCHFQFLFRIF